jgi:hypothetical protein
VAFDAALFDYPTGDLPRIHERFLIYVVPLFLIALFSTLARASRASTRIYLAAGACAALLPLAIPFHTVVNGTTIVDTFSLQPFAFPHHGELSVVSHGRLVAVLAAAVLALLYVLARRRERELVLLVLVPFLVVSGLLLPRISQSSILARGFLPQEMDWVDAAKPRGDVALIFGTRRAPALETAFGNQSISRLYYLCRQGTAPEFGEQKATIDAAGRLREPLGAIRSTYVVAPVKLGIQGRVVARNRPGNEVLVAPTDGRLTIPPAQRAAALRCPPPKTGR